MKIAIVRDTAPTNRWADTWKALAEKNSIEYREFDSNIDAFLDSVIAYNPNKILWRSGNFVISKFKDEAYRLLLDKTKIQVVSNWNTHWLFDHKIRQTCLFKLHNIPHPETHIYFTEKEAMDSLKTVEYPFVIKADGGAGSKSIRFVEDKETGMDIIGNAFRRQGKWTGHEYENHVIYAQEYLPIKYIWRVSIFKNKLAWGVKQSVKPGTIKASNQGLYEFPPVPNVLLNLVLRIGKKLKWDWGMCDFAWNEKHKQWQILEVCDTCGRPHMKRELTYYKMGSKWISKKENTSAQELIFRLFVLEESWRRSER